MRRLRFVMALFAMLAAVGLVPSGEAAAISLNEARVAGLVGETRSGYLAPTAAPSGEVQALIQSVNSKRRTHYRSIAERNGLRIEEVGRLTAEKIINGLPGGAYFQATDGNWRRK